MIHYMHICIFYRPVAHILWKPMYVKTLSYKERKKTRLVISKNNLLNKLQDKYAVISNLRIQYTFCGYCCMGYNYLCSNNITAYHLPWPCCRMTLGLNIIKCGYASSTGPNEEEERT